MTESEVVALMRSSKSADEWNTNAKKVKASNGGSYPKFWYKTIIESDIMAETVAAFEITD
jgi:hypothetical protein